MFCFSSSDYSRPLSLNNGLGKGHRASSGTFFVLLMLLLVVSASSSRQQPPQDGHLCKPITVPMCTGIGYNTTIMPNLLGQQSQDDAGMEVQQFSSLVEIRCSRDLRFFLCSIYVPACNTSGRPVPPCRSLCTSALSACESIVKAYSFVWPEELQCSRFPETGEPCVVARNGTIQN